MAYQFKYFIKGIWLKLVSSDPTDNINGSIWNRDNTNLKTYIDGAVREIITDSQSQTLSNKTLTSPIINTSVSGTAIDTDDTLAANSDTLLASQKAVKGYVDTGLATKQDVITGLAGLTDNRILRADGADNLQGSGVTLNDLDEISGVTKLDVDNVRIDGNEISTTSGSLDLNPTSEINANKELKINSKLREDIETDSTTTGANVTLPLPSKSIVRLTNASLTSIDMIDSPVSGQVVTIINHTGNNIAVSNDTGATAANRILTGTQTNINLKDESSVVVKYDGVEQRWIVIGGTGGGASGSISALAGETIAIGDALYISTGTGDDALRTAGRVYKLDVNSDDRFVFAGFATNNGNAGDSITLQISGEFEFTHGGAAGETLYADSSIIGGITNVAPTTPEIWSTILGVAVDANKLIICNIGSISSIYLEKTQGTASILNNTTGDVTDLIFDASEVRSFMVHYSVRRSTDTSKADESGLIIGRYDFDANDWDITVGLVVGSAGMNFSIDNLGQVNYTSSNLSGTSYTGNIKYKILSTTEV